MDHVVTIFDNTLEYIPADKGLNYIVCEGYSEVFFGVYQITVNGNKFIGEGVDTIKGLPVVKLPVIIDGVEHDALFALKSDPSQTGVVINVNSLSNGRQVILDEKQAVEEIAKEVEITPIDEVFEETTNVSESIKIDIERYKQDALRVISENFKDKKVKLENLQEALKDFISENVNNVKQSTLVNLEEFKTDVIRTVETIVETNKVDTDSSIAEINALKENISALVNGYVTDLEFTSSEKVAALEELQEKVSFEIDSKLHDLESQANNYKQVAEEEYKKLETFVIDSEKSLTEQNQSNAETIRKLIESVGEKSEEIDRLVESKIKIFRSLATEETATITTLIGNKLLEFDSKIESVGQGLIEAVEAKVKNANLVAIKKEDLSSLKKQLEDKINTESANLKKYVAGYGGGGSVAVQYADGGIMNGTLNIASGQILSGGVDLYDIFSSGGGGFQTLSFNESDATLTITPNGNTISLSALSGGGGGSATGAYLPLSGGTLTGDLEIQAAITAVDSIQFTLTSGITTVPGQLAWNAEESTLNLGVNSDVTLQIGQEQLIQVKNTSGQVIYNGAPVFASGASGGGSGNITVSAYRAGANDADELYFLGVATQELADNDFGFITTFGKVRGVVVSQVQATDDVGPLSAWDIGTILYPSATEAGRFTSTPPVAPNKDLPVAMVISVNGNQRSFFIRAEHGYHLDELHDVSRATPSDGNVLTFSSLSGVWYPKAPETNYLPLSGGTVTGTTVFTGTLSATLIEAVSANFTVIDIKQYELSGFNVEGNVTVSGTISSNNIVYANGGNSNNWNSAYTTLNANSGSWDSVYSTVNTYSATDWNYQGSDIKALTANWENTYTDFSGQSSSNVSVYSTVNSKSASWDSVYSSFNAQSGANASVYSSVNSNSASWDSVYSTVNSNSATQWNYQGSDIKSLTANWQNTYTDFSGQSSNNAAVYSTVNSNSASWDSVYSGFNTQSAANAAVYSTVNSKSASWDSVYSGFNAQSAANASVYSGFNAQSGSNASVYSNVNSKSASWDSVYSSFNAQSAANASVYSTVNSNSATQWNYQGSDIKALTANWENTYSTVNTTSATWLQTLAFDEVTSILSISDSNSVSLSALNESSVFSNYLPLSGGTLTGPVSTNQDIEITDSTKGIILRSPSNFKYRITVTDAGELVTTAI